jgi:hypothetical protein
MTVPVSEQINEPTLHRPTLPNARESSGVEARNWFSPASMLVLPHRSHQNQRTADHDRPLPSSDTQWTAG